MQVPARRPVSRVELDDPPRGAGADAAADNSDFAAEDALDVEVCLDAAVRESPEDRVLHGACEIGERWNGGRVWPFECDARVSFPWGELDDCGVVRQRWSVRCANGDGRCGHRSWWCGWRGAAVICNCYTAGYEDDASG